LMKLHGHHDQFLLLLHGLRNGTGCIQEKECEGSLPTIHQRECRGFEGNG
jgi:hypothetical protein